MTRQTKAQLKEENELLRAALARLQSLNRRHAQIIGMIPRAKRQAGFPLKSVFFRDVWPVVLAAYLEKKERG
jgi:hypothetical protein